MRHLIILTLCCASLWLSAQERMTYLDPAEAMKEAGLAMEAGEPEAALTLLRGIDENDSLYPEAFLMICRVLSGENRHQEIPLLARHELGLGRGERQELMHIMVTAYLNLEEPEKALHLLDSVLIDYPYSAKSYFYKGHAYKKLNDRRQALANFIRAAELNVYYPAPHLEIGNLCQDEGLIAQALLAYNSYLLLNNGPSNALDLLVFMNEMVSSKTETNPSGSALSPDDEAFREIDLVLGNYAALSGEYRTDNPIDVPLVKQNHALFSMFADYEGTQGFWSRVYVPFYRNLMERGSFNDFIYRIMNATTNEKFAKVISKNEGGQAAFVNWVAEAWKQHMRAVAIHDLKPDGGSIHYYPSGEVNSVGAADAEGNPCGFGYYYFKEGNLMSEGRLENGKYQGDWIWYNARGKRSRVAQVKDDQLHGRCEDYHPNGVIFARSTYEHGDYNGEYREYSAQGILQLIAHYRKGTLHGDYQTFHPLGEAFPDYQYHFEEGLIQGEVRKYYPNGQLELAVSMVDGKKEGKEEQYFMHGSLKEVVHYSDGLRQGEVQQYHKNGALSLKGSFQNDLPSGEWVEYRADSTVLQKYSHNQKGELEGEYHDFDAMGRLASISYYANGKVMRIVSYDKEGNIITDDRRQGSRILLANRYTNGNPRTAGEYYIEGQKQGNWKYYGIYGELVNEENYENGILEGPFREYWNDGTLKTYHENHANLIHGYSATYYPDGRIKEEGYMTEGQAHGPWRDYYANGGLRTSVFFDRGSRNGISRYYSPEGQPWYQEHYLNGVLEKTEMTDTLGRVVQTIDHFSLDTFRTFFYDGRLHTVKSFRSGVLHGPFLTYHPNGKLASRGAFFNGTPHGNWETYHENGSLYNSTSYLYGESHGVWKGYYEDGTPEMVIRFSYGQPEGIWTYFSYSGDTTHVVRFHNGQRHGPARFMDNQGSLQMVRYYENGELMAYLSPGPSGANGGIQPLPGGSGEMKTYFPDGRLARVMHMMHGELHGEFTSNYNNGLRCDYQQYKTGSGHGLHLEYYPDGKPKIETSYLNGEEHGIQKKYSPEGKLLSVLTYQCGVLHGPAQFYDDQGRMTRKAIFANDMIVYEEKL
ncbi:MAG TPA: hypothetical protein P5550_03060 [Bacteroidales bacterium]|nr:hypothetical protein [Bacteroidales bacterium]